MDTHWKRLRQATIAFAFLALLLPKVGAAYSVEKLNVDVRNDFVLEPGKEEISLDPGQTITKSIAVTNRAAKKVTFKIEVEDFIGTSDEQNPVDLLGDDRSPYSFKDNVVPEVKEFSINPGERATIPVTITAPAAAEARGYYESVLVSNVPDEASSTEQTPQTKVISRLGVLFFIRVNGAVNDSGHLDDFRISPARWVYENADFNFQVLYKNDGTVHEVPYGEIDIKNMFGSLIASLPIDAYFSLPDTIRYREVSWARPALIGRYTATISLHKGYGDGVDVRTISFWVIPWKILVIVFVALALFLTLFYYFLSRFEFRRKK